VRAYSRAQIVCVYLHARAHHWRRRGRKRKKRSRESERMSWREGGEGGGMRETFSSVPTARATPLSFPLRVFSLCFSHRRTHLCVCECTRVRVYKRAVCPSTESSSVTQWGRGGGGGGGHRRRWTARDAAYRESLREIETARPLCLFVYGQREKMRASEGTIAGQGDDSSRFLLPPSATFIHRRHIGISRRGRNSESTLRGECPVEIRFFFFIRQVRVLQKIQL